MSHTITNDFQELPTPWTITFSQQHHTSFSITQPTRAEEECILRIFRKANFSRLSLIDGLERPLESWLTDPDFMIDDLLYERIRPALILATKFILASHDFFDCIWNHGIRSEDNKAFYDHDHETAPENRYHWHREILENISNFQIFTGWHQDHERVEIKHNHATLHYGQHPQNAHEKIRTCALQLNNEFTAFFNHPSYEQWPTEKIQRTHFILATTITHEIVHLCYRFRWHTGLGTDMASPENEPRYYKTDPTAELGLAWERWAFGGTPDLKYENGYKPYTEGKALGILGLEQVPCWSGCQAQAILKVKALDPSDIAAFFDEQCWKYFRVLRSGKHPLYSEAIGNNFLETMKSAVHMKEFRISHGELPYPNQIRKVELREDHWDNQGTDQAVNQLAPRHDREASTSTSTTTAAATRAPADFSNAWRVLGSGPRYLQARNSEGARRR
jgi:hypothetical protein